ncbi:MORC family CW-type zinc finger protein 3-like isoform X3 [Neoarius graeffei]|uniref:MORC family CW-type zinc finger protein 3-like isoform X3 n=1 Tax=Neoarius graeffei TaxID=443677 RepID=UPI00298CE48D|nr:MORC family CW-type zinc finger protein 3-like isoform X3 [Neoarius graeffei]
MAALTKRGIPLCSISPQYLHSNSTSHTWPFGAIAELIDNAYDPDVSAKKIWINKTEVKGLDCLTFTDNGKGMDYEKMHKMLSFGFSHKEAVKGHVSVGLYGNGFKSGSMRLGKDAIVFSKNGETMCVGLLSQTYLEEIGAQDIMVPIVMFTRTKQTVSPAPEHVESLSDILKHSLFNTSEELLSQFRIIDRLYPNSSGTHIIIWNLRRRSSGELEFDFKKNPYDIKIPVDVYTKNRETPKREAAGGVLVPESEYSLRAYCSILYLKPRMQIILQDLEVETLYFPDILAEVHMDTYKPACFTKGTKIIFGYNTKSKEHYGLMMYHNNRLIKAYERVPCQRKADNTGEGVIGVIECNYLKPTHNKQDFDDTEDYRNTMTNVSKKLKDYWGKNCYNWTGTFKDTVKLTQKSQHENRQHVMQSSDSSSVKFPKRKKKTLNLNQKNPEKKKARRKDSRVKSTQHPHTKHQSPSSPKSSCQTTPRSALLSSSHTGAGSRPSGITSVVTWDTPVPSTPTRKRSKDLNQKNQNQKKARRKSFYNIPSSSSEEQQNYEIQYQQMIKQLQNKVDSLVDERRTLLTCYERLQKDSEEMKKEKVKVSVEDQGVQTDFPISSHEESAATSAEASNSGTGRNFDTQQHETQDRPEIGQENNNMQSCSLRLRELRQRVAHLLVAFVPALDLQQVNYDCEVIDEILTQVIDQISPTEATST